MGVTTQPNRETRLAALAREATPGPWVIRRSVDADPMTSGDVGIQALSLQQGDRHLPLIGEVFSERVRGRPDRVQAKADATYIAAADPQVIAAMAAVVGAARKAAWVFDCLCDPDYTKRNLHGPECHLEDGDALCDALAAWDALEEAK